MEPAVAPDTHPTAGEPAGAGSPSLPRTQYLTPQAFRQRVYATFGRRPSKSTLHRWLQSGRIAAVRVGKFWLIPESAWDEFLARARDGLQF
jgi:excisionase family DNA binding protein